MTKRSLNRERFFRRQLRAILGWSRNAPLFLFSTAVALSVEVLAAGGIFAEDTAVVPVGPFHVRIAYAKAVMSAAMSMLSLVLASAASAQKADPRAPQQRRAGWTQTLAVLALIGPMYFAAQYLALGAERAEQAQFHVSQQRLADIAIVNDPQADSIVKQNAAEDLKRDVFPTSPDAGHMTPALLGIGLVLGLNMLMVRAGWRAKPTAKRRAKRSPKQTSNVVRLAKA